MKHIRGKHGDDAVIGLEKVGGGTTPIFVVPSTVLSKLVEAHRERLF